MRTIENLTRHQALSEQRWVSLNFTYGSDAE